MAILQLENGTTYTAPEDIDRELAPLQVSLKRWEITKDPAIAELLAKESLDNEEKELVLNSLDRYFDKLKTTAGYQSRDLIVLHPEFPDLSQLLSKFAYCHTHADDEVRYVIDGEGVFGFVRPDRSQVKLTIQPEEYINVPAGTEHWFHLTQSNRIKAVRYFTTTEGWTPEYTGTEIEGLGIRH
jgi:1,2-dihydroxy-3-keto-5-methylthiopentene dioxygenase